MTSLIEEKGTVKGVKYKNKDGQDIKAFAPLTIVCDGCFSNLRKTLCIPQVRKRIGKEKDTCLTRKSENLICGVYSSCR